MAGSLTLLLVENVNGIAGLVLLVLFRPRAIAVEVLIVSIVFVNLRNPTATHESAYENSDSTGVVYRGN